VEWTRKPQLDPVDKDTDMTDVGSIPVAVMPSNSLAQGNGGMALQSRQPCASPHSSQVMASCAFIQSERDRRYNAYSMAFSSSNWHVVVLKKFSKRTTGN